MHLQSHSLLGIFFPSALINTFFSVFASQLIAPSPTTVDDGGGIVKVDSGPYTAPLLPLYTNNANEERQYFGILNETLSKDDSNVTTLTLTPENDLALAILANDTSTDTGNATLDDLISKSRHLLGIEYSWKPDDRSSYGNFSVYNCGPIDPLTSTAAREVRDALARIQLNLITVAYEVKKYGTRSRYGFSALFKSNQRKNQILRNYEKMMVGASVIRRDLGLPNTPKPETSPQAVRLYCFRPEITSPLARAGYQQCLANPNYIAFWILGGSTIGLCPLFFQIHYNPANEDCPKFSRGQMQGDGSPMSINQEAALVHELAHLYIAHDTEEESGTLEEAMALGTKEQADNAANYAYFYSCKSFGDFIIHTFVPDPVFLSERCGDQRANFRGLTAVIAKCVGWPKLTHDDDGL